MVNQPLAYVIREDVDLPTEDPGFGLPTFKEEMIRRTRHDTPSFLEDNHSVWTMIRTVTHGGPAWHWVSTHERSMNGRAAYFSLKSH